jgi:hypothetical protein
MYALERRDHPYLDQACLFVYCYALTCHVTLLITGCHSSTKMLIRLGIRILTGLIKDSLLVHVPMSSHVAPIPC